MTNTYGFALLITSFVLGLYGFLLFVVINFYIGFKVKFGKVRLTWRQIMMNATWLGIANFIFAAGVFLSSHVPPAFDSTARSIFPNLTIELLCFTGYVLMVPAINIFFSMLYRLRSNQE